MYANTTGVWVTGGTFGSFPGYSNAGGKDVVLAGDVFYERALAARSSAWFGALAAAGVRVLAGDAGRAYAPADGFVERAADDVPTTVEIEDAPVRRARVLEFLPP